MLLVNLLDTTIITLLSGAINKPREKRATRNTRVGGGGELRVRMRGEFSKSGLINYTKARGGERAIA